MKKNICLFATVLALLLAFIFTSCDGGLMEHFFEMDDQEDGPAPLPPVPTPVTYTIRFDSNGGTGTMDSVTVEKGAGYTIPASGFSELPGTMRRFTGWNTAADGSGTAYAVADTVAVTADTTMYAQWTNPAFSVSATKKVYFSKGNLYWDGSAYHFETNQYDLTPVFDTNWDTSHVSHFYFSKNASIARATGYSDAGKSVSDVLFTNDPSDATKPNSYFCVSGVTGKYRALTLDDSVAGGEWMYLCNTRTVNGGTGAGYSYVYNHSGTTIEGNTYYGLFLFPDDYTGTTDMSTLTWTQINDAGIVFLPKPGNRSGDNISAVNYKGSYLSSCAYNENTMFGTIMNDSSFAVRSAFGRSNGCSIRLVVDATP